MREVRDFQLVLRADVRESLGECVVQIFKEVATVYKEKREFGDASSTNRWRPTALVVVYELQGALRPTSRKDRPSHHFASIVIFFLKIGRLNEQGGENVV